MYKLANLKTIKHFDFLSEMVDYCMDTAGKKKTGYGESQDFEFTDSRNMEHAAEIARSGWVDGVKEMAAQISLAHAGLDSYEGYAGYMDVVGPIPIVGAFCSGDPECMYTPCAPDEKPVINMVVDCNMIAAVDKSLSMRRGAAIVALAEKLEMAGRSVAIYATCTAEITGGAGTFCVCVKQADAEFNLHSIAFALIHPSFYRRLGFRIWEFAGTFGGSRSIMLTDIEGIENSIGDIDIYLPCINQVSRWHSTFRTQERTNDYVLGVARDAGVIV